MDKKLNNFSESIINEVGNTPLIKLKKASEITGWYRGEPQLRQQPG